MTVKRLAAVLGLVTATAGAVGATYAALDYLGVRPVISRELRAVEQQVAANTSWVQLTRWKQLHVLARQGRLTPAQRREYCWLSRQLGFVGIGCR